MIILIMKTGEKYSFLDNISGKLNNYYGKAILSKYDNSYWVNDRLHNEHGPAIIRNNKTEKKYYLDGVKYSLKDFNDAIEMEKSPLYNIFLSSC